MTLDTAERQRRIRNYSVMLRLALACFGIAILVTMAGGVNALSGGDPVLVVYGMFFAIWSVGSAYLTVDSVTRIIDEDEARGHFWSRGRHN